MYIKYYLYLFVGINRIHKIKINNKSIFKIIIYYSNETKANKFSIKFFNIYTIIRKIFYCILLHHSKEIKF